MDKDGVRTQLRDGNYRVKDGGNDIITITGDKLSTNGSSHGAKLKYGSFGEADPKIVEMTGEKCYNLESKYDVVGKEMADYGVVIDEGTTIVFKGMMGITTLEWISDEEAEQMANDCDPIEAPTSHYKVEPERQGRLIWITGPPGLGKSTSAQLLSREHGYVYYEGDCFFNLKNPYIPSDVENPSVAQVMQRKLVGEGVAERREICNQAIKQWQLKMAGKEYDRAAEEGMYRDMCNDIARERARIGGDWAIATVLDSPHIRDFVRLFYCSHSFLIIFVRGELGPELEIVVLEMTLEEQKARIRGRHEGSEDAVGMMAVNY